MRNIDTIRLKDFLKEPPRCPVCSIMIYGDDHYANKYALQAYTCISDLDYVDEVTGDIYMFESFKCREVFLLSPVGYTPTANIKGLLYGDD